MHPRGRGARFNPPNRFLPDYVEPDDSQAGPEQPGLLTQFLPDSPREIISHVNSPDIPFSYSVNPYQGCEHGCIYCYARNTHEFWGFSAGLDFERKIMVKHQAPALLRHGHVQAAGRWARPGTSPPRRCRPRRRRRRRPARTPWPWCGPGA